MKRKPNSKVPQRDLKEEIVNRAIKGVFDRNPLLAVPHQVVCKACGFTQKTMYINYLKCGKFELGETRMVEVSYAAPTIFGFSHAMEKITPIIFAVICERCGNEVSCSPLNLEYLLFTATREQKLRNMFV